MMERIYSFTYDQLKVLLLGCGYNKVAGLNIANTTLENEQALNALNELSKSGFIFSDGESFEVDSEIKRIISCLGESSGYMVVHSNSLSLPDKCLFLSDKVLMCSSRNNDKTHICAQYIGYEDVFGSFLDEGYVPAQDSDFVLDEAELVEYEKEIFLDYRPNDALSSSSSVLFSVEELSIDSQLLRYMRVVDYYFYTYIVYYDGENTTRELYSNENIKNYFEKMINI